LHPNAAGVAYLADQLTGAIKNVLSTGAAQAASPLPYRLILSALVLAVAATALLLLRSGARQRTKRR